MHWKNLCETQNLDPKYEKTSAKSRVPVISPPNIVACHHHSQMLGAKTFHTPEET